MAASRIDGIGVDLTYAGFEVDAKSSQSCSWSLGCEIVIEEIDAPIQEIKVNDVVLSGKIYTKEISVDIDTDRDSIMDLDVSVAIGGISSTIATSQVSTYDEILEITSLSPESANEKKYAASALAAKKIYDSISELNQKVDDLSSATPEIPDIDLSDCYTKKEIDVKVTAINNRIAIFEEWFKDDGNGNIKTTYDFYSTKTLAAGAVGSAGSGEGDGGGGSVNAISVDGVVYSPTDGIIDLSRAFANVEVDLSDYYTKREVDGKIGAIDFTAYLTKDAASDTYATKNALSLLQNEVDNIELMLSGGTKEYIDTWNDVVAFLDGYKDSDDLSAILSKINSRIAIFEDWFKDDGSGNIKTTYNFYSTRSIAAGGAGEEGGAGGGGVALLTSWQNIPSDLSGYALGATLGVDLNSRVTTLEGKATAVSFAQTLTSGKAIGTITIDGTSKVLYAPSKLSQFEDDVVAGKYLPLSGGVLRGGSADLFVINRLSSTSAAYITFKGNNTLRGRIGFDANNNPTVQDINYGTGNHTLIHSENIGKYALKTDGSNVMTSYITLTTDSTRMLALKSSTGANRGQLGADTNSGQLIWRNLQANESWRYVAFTDSDITGNAGSATKLQTARTIWGQSFDGTGNVSGNITLGAASIRGYDNRNILESTDNDLMIGYGYTASSLKTTIWGNTIKLSNAVLINSSGNVTIGDSDLAGTNTKLYVAGSKLSLRLTTATEMQLYVANSLARTGILISSTGKSGLYDYNNDKWIIGCEGTTKTWLGNGNVGIGTEWPAYKLDVNGTLRASGAATLSSTLSVTSTSTFTGKTTHNGGIGATSGTFSTTLGVTGATTLGSTLNVTGATTLKSTLGVTGATTLSSTLSVSGLLTASSGIKIAAGQSITFLDSSGNTHTLSYDSANKAFKFNGNAYATGQIAAGAAGSEEAGSGAVGGSEGAAGALEVDLNTLIGEEGTIAEGTLASVGLTQDALTGLLNGSYTKVVDLSYGVYNYIAYIHSNGYSIYIYRRENIMDDVGETYRITKSDSKYIVSYAEV